MSKEISDEIRQLYKKFGRMGYENQRLEPKDIAEIMQIAEKETDFDLRCRVVYLFISAFKEGIEDMLFEDSPYCNRSARSKYY